MTEASESFWLWLLGGVIALAKLLIAYLFHKVDRVTEKQSIFETRVAEQYASKSEIEKMDEKLDRILDKLDAKADKPVR